MAIKGVIFSNQKVSAADHARIFRKLIGDGVLYGCSISATLNTCKLSSGSLIIAGRMINIVGEEEFTITGSAGDTVGRIIGQIDLKKVAEKDEFGQVSFIVETETSEARFRTLVREDINNGGSLYEFMLAKFSIAANGTITITSRIGGSGSGGDTPVDPSVSGPAYTFQNGSADADNELMYLADGSWLLKLKANGTLNFSGLNGVNRIDVFVVGGGGSAGVSGVSGGGGGYTTTQKNVAVSTGVDYAVTIGAGGANGADGQASSISIGGSTISANGGKAGSIVNGVSKGGAGGSGGSAVCGLDFCAVGGSDGSSGYSFVNSTTGTIRGGNAGAGQGTSTRAFGESAGELYAAGGAGASKYSNASEGNSTTDYISEAYWNNKGQTTSAPGGGGTTGGPSHSGQSQYTPGPGGNGKANTGSGGGASATEGGGAGGSGVILIRAHKE